MKEIKIHWVADRYHPRGRCGFVASFRTSTTFRKKVTCGSCRRSIEAHRKRCFRQREML